MTDWASSGTGYKADVGLLTGVKGVIELEYEPIGLNQAKGRVSAFMGELFKDLIEGESNLKVSY